MSKYKLLALLLAVGIQGCSNNEVIPDKESASAGAIKEIKRVALEIREDNRQLATLKQQQFANNNVQRPKSLATKDVPVSLQKALTLRWEGRATHLLGLIADSIDYKYIPSEGKEPIMPLLASVDVTDVQAYQVLRDIGLQLDQRAMLVVDVSKRELRLSYLGR